MEELSLTEVDILASVERTIEEAYNGLLRTKVKLKNGELLELHNLQLDTSGRARKLVPRDPYNTRYYPISQETYTFGENGDRIAC